MVYNLICNIFILVYVGNTQNNIKMIEQHFQDVAQKVQHNENLDTFATHFAQYFNQKRTPQHSHEIMSFGIIYIINPIGLMKTCGKS